MLSLMTSLLHAILGEPAGWQHPGQSPRGSEQDVARAEESLRARDRAPTCVHFDRVQPSFTSFGSSNMQYVGLSHSRQLARQLRWFAEGLCLSCWSGL